MCRKQFCWEQHGITIGTMLRSTFLVRKPVTSWQLDGARIHGGYRKDLRPDVSGRELINTIMMFMTMAIIILHHLSSHDNNENSIDT